MGKQDIAVDSQMVSLKLQLLHSATGLSAKGTLALSYSCCVSVCLLGAPSHFHHAQPPVSDEPL